MSRDLVGLLLIGVVAIFLKVVTSPYFGRTSFDLAPRRKGGVPWPLALRRKAIKDRDHRFISQEPVRAPKPPRPPKVEESK